MKKPLVLLGLLSVGLAAGCSNVDGRVQVPPAMEPLPKARVAAIPNLPRPASRPRDPWVFRSVLDGHARMLTVALADDCWITYDTQTCGLVKAWRGNVLFTGGVYDTKHGPQPKSIGPAYFSATQPSKVDMTPELTLADGTTVKPKYGGYVVRENAVVVSYRYDLPGGKRVEVSELPERVDSGAVGGAAAGGGGGNAGAALLRTFRVTGLPQGGRIVVPLLKSSDGKSALELAGSAGSARGSDGSFSVDHVYGLEAK